MAYIKYKEITKYPLGYVFEDEKMLVSYKIQGIMVCLLIKR